MKTRISSRVVAVCLLFLAAGLGLNSCKPDLVTPTVGQAEFGSIRVMNFRECGVPFDVFIFKTNVGVTDTVINRSLAYSVGSAYATNLTPGTYRIEVRPLNLIQVLASLDVTVNPNEAWTVLAFKEGEEGVRLERAPHVDQQVGNFDPTKVYVRFLNTKSDYGDVDLVFDNPLGSPTFDNVAPRTLTPYIALNHALDTSYALYLVDANNNKNVISRMAGAAWGPGQFYTVVFAGNNNDCRDTNAIKADTLRLRYFDDNQQGNDLTYPLVQSLRFNIINGLISPPNPGPEQRAYTTAGVVINNDDRFLIPALKPKQMARNLGTTNDGVIIGGFFTTTWTEAIQVSMYSVPEGNTDPRAQRGIKLVDLRAGNRRDIKSDVPFSIIIMDTVSSRTTAGIYHVDSSKIVSWSVPLPDVPAAGQAKIVVVNALAPVAKEGVSQPSKHAKIYVNGEAPRKFTSAQRAPAYDTLTVPAGKVEIKVDIGRTDVINTLTRSFQAEAEGIYQVVAIGQNKNTGAGSPEILVIHTNKVNQ